MSPIPLGSYGLLLAFDGYGAPRSLCADTSLLTSVLSELPPFIGMRTLGSPHIVRVDEKNIAGLSGFTFIMESHVSIHTYEERGFVTADIYSCKEFDARAAAQYLSSVFGVSSFETNVIPRGIHFENSRPSRHSP